MSDNKLYYFPGNKNTHALTVTRTNNLPLLIDIEEWNTGSRIWKINSEGNYQFKVSGLKADSNYSLFVNGTETGKLNSDSTGSVSFDFNCSGKNVFSLSLF